MGRSTIIMYTGTVGKGVCIPCWHKERYPKHGDAQLSISKTLLMQYFFSQSSRHIFLQHYCSSSITFHIAHFARIFVTEFRTVVALHWQSRCSNCSVKGTVSRLTGLNGGRGHFLSNRSPPHNITLPGWGGEIGTRNNIKRSWDFSML
jgi:hypothetical protein